MDDRVPTPQEAWTEACWEAEEYVKAASFEDTGNMAIEIAHKLLAIAHQLKGVACSACKGRGVITYGDVSTWTRAVGWQQLTDEVCEQCWGTGRSDKIGVTQKKSCSAAGEALLAENKMLDVQNKQYAEENDSLREQHTTLTRTLVRKDTEIVRLQSICEQQKYELTHFGEAYGKERKKKRRPLRA